MTACGSEHVSGCAVFAARTGRRVFPSGWESRVWLLLMFVRTYTGGDLVERDRLLAAIALVNPHAGWGLLREGVWIGGGRCRRERDRTTVDATGESGTNSGEDAALGSGDVRGTHN